MCQMVVFWHACTHLIVSYMTCAFEEARNHKEQTATTALIDTDCWICQQRQKHPSWGVSGTMQRLLMTVQNMEYILGVSANEDGFLDMVARFYARGDHKRWMQPGIAKAKYTKDDPYVRGLEVQSYLCTRGQRDFHMNPGYAFDIYFALMKHSNRADYSDLNWSMTGYRPPSDFFYVSSSMLDMLADGCGVEHRQKTRGAHVARGSRCLSNGGSVAMPTTQSTLASFGIGDSAEIGLGHPRTASYTQGLPTHPPLDAQTTSSVHNVNGNPGSLLPRRPCETLNGPPIAMNHYAQHILHPLSPLGEPGPSIENHLRALDERASHHARTPSVFHPIFSAEYDGDILTNEASQELDLHHHTRSNSFTYNNTLPTENIPYLHVTPLTHIYTDPSSFSLSNEPTRHLSKNHNSPEDNTHLDILFSSPTLGSAIPNPRNPAVTIDPSILKLDNPDQLNFPDEATCGNAKGKQPIRDTSQLDPRVPGGFVFPGNMDITQN
ncbi:hypothetical protein BDV38DRAFT_278052 [Aspergillus pseudotamarii]|uniref:Uncharacterized protein n=1 Tax=Aspergillus pseudotamarii TaxID=132259 RepID=A0A5N6T8K6_ASPPS|nr:uncharacterized protein BDV38DRAFT_278052 [Aspergillus pseudotamarii]KAE8142529.1 hypothetical protein BDV38DRAFT_278052 [Aspergillus pseudotamarii]